MNKEKITFQDCFKTFTRDQDKALTPEETISRFFQRIEQFDCKILSEVKRIDNGRLDIPVYFSVCTDEARALTGTKKQMGKGASPIQSKASACMELAERFSFFSFTSAENNFIRGDYRLMREQNYPVLEPSYLLKSVDDESMNSEQLEELLEGIPMQWTWGTNLTADELVLIPFSWFYAINEFNGSSAGNTLEEAALQGISEVVERHVCAKVNRYRLETPRIDQDSINDPVARELLEKFRKNNIELYLSDFSLDTGICTVGALAFDPETFPRRARSSLLQAPPPARTRQLYGLSQKLLNWQEISIRDQTTLLPDCRNRWRSMRSPISPTAGRQLPLQIWLSCQTAILKLK